MTMQRPGVQSLAPTIKPFVRSKANGKVFVLLRDDSGIGGSGDVFISRPQALSDNIRMTKEELIEHFDSFNEILMVQDPRVAVTPLDLDQATYFLTIAARQRSEANVAARDAMEGATPGAPATPAAAPAEAPKKRGRPKGSKNKPKPTAEVTTE